MDFDANDLLVAAGLILIAVALVALAGPAWAALITGAIVLALGIARGMMNR